MREQRRLAAIVSADVVGYSRLMGRDESGTLAALKALRREIVDPQIAAHGGRIVKTTGDGLLLEFPSVVDAVRCVVEVQSAMTERIVDIPEDRRIAFRIGVNLGDIIIDGDDIFGDGVNIAARLQEIAAPGGVCVSSRVHEDIRDRLDTSFEDGGTQAFKNIARPIQVWRWSPGGLAPAATTASLSMGVPLTLPDKPSIAVLPFQNMSGDPEQEYFADGMAEDIITALSRFKSLFVIARNSSFAYKGKSPDIRQVGRDLGVRYVLEGSVRKAANRVRITGQLIETETGAHRWADRIDAALEDIFQLQDEVTQKVVAALVPTVERAEIERANRKPMANLGAYDFYLRGLAAQQPLTKETNEESIRLFRQALELDPDNAPAIGKLLGCYANRRGFGTVVDANQEKEEVVRLVHLAVHGEDGVALGRAAWTIGYVLRDLTFAKEQIERALALNPNAANTWANSGWISLWSGNAARALEDLSRAMRLDPIARGTLPNGLAHAHFFLDQFQEALQWAENQLRENPQAHAGLRIGAASAALAGKVELAHVFAARLTQTDPSFCLARLEDYLGPYQAPSFLEKLRQGLREAGLPE